MEQNIIQHHEPFDFESFFEDIKSQYIGLDYHDFSNFMHNSGEKHSFVGNAEGKDRVKVALENVMASSEAMGIIKHASDVMIVIVRSSESSEPVTMNEIGTLNEFISGFPKNCEVVGGLAEDASLGNTIKAVILINANE